MFNVGPGEVIVIALVLLIAVGPEQLPGVIRKAGKTVAQVRAMTDGLRSEFVAGLEELERATDVAGWAESGSSEPAEFVKVAPPQSDSAPSDELEVDDAELDMAEVDTAEIADAELGQDSPDVVEETAQDLPNGHAPMEDRVEEPPFTEQESA